MNHNKEIIKNEVPTSINLSPVSNMDISHLNEEERKALLTEYQKGMLDISTKAQELHVDSAALKKSLDDFSNTAKEVSADGNSVQITHTQTTKLGRTEIIMGNTKQAETGKFSNSQTGEKSLLPIYVIGAIIIIIVAIVAGK